MARSRIRQTSVEANTDNGSILFSFAIGEQQLMDVTLDFLNTLDNITLEAVMLEGANAGGRRPRGRPADGNGQTRKLQIVVNYTDTEVLPDGSTDTPRTGTGQILIDSDVMIDPATSGPVFPAFDDDDSESLRRTAGFTRSFTNSIRIVFPEAMGTDWDTQPQPDQPVYAFFGLKVAEQDNAGIPGQIWKPLRGLVELVYSPTDIF